MAFTQNYSRSNRKFGSGVATQNTQAKPSVYDNAISYVNEENSHQYDNQRTENLLNEIEVTKCDDKTEVVRLLKQAFRGYPDVHYEAVAIDIKKIFE